MGASFGTYGLLAAGFRTLATEPSVQNYRLIQRSQCLKDQTKPLDDLSFVDLGFTLIDMFKTDTEGFDVFFLQGAKHSLLKFRPRHVWAEVSHELHGFSLKDVLSRFWEVGYKVYF